MTVAYCEHLEVLKDDMIKRFTDLLELETPDWIIDPFSVDIDEVSLELQEELSDMHNDCVKKVRFKMMGYERFWQGMSVRNKFPNMWKVAKLLTLAFPTSYLVERGFSAVIQLLTKQRNKLDIPKSGDLRLLLTEMRPNVKNLLKSITHKCTLRIDQYSINTLHSIIKLLQNCNILTKFSVRGGGGGGRCRQ